MPKNEIIYSAQKRDFIKGHRYANPRYFSTTANDVTSVIVVGKWQEIVDAYRMKAANVTITVVGDQRELEELLARRASGNPEPPRTPQVKPPAPIRKDAEPVRVVSAEITLPPPEDIATLAFPALRQLAARLSNAEIGSRKQAEAIIERERARRKAAHQ